MVTQTLVKKLEKEVKSLKEEVGRFRTLFFNIPEGNEGEYRAEFVQEVLRAAKRKPKKTYEYKKRGDLIRHLRAASRS